MLDGLSANIAYATALPSQHGRWLVAECIRVYRMLRLRCLCSRLHSTTPLAQSSTLLSASRIANMPGKRTVRSDTVAPTISGVDTDGRAFDNITQLWQEELHFTTPPPADTATSTEPASPANGRKRRWYDKGAEYWQTQPATYDGVLGGFGRLSPLDVRDSRIFLSSLPHITLPSTQLSAIDCGAGVGRIAQDLLCPLFGRVDLVEQDETYVRTAKQTITHASMRDMYVCGLQDFDFAHPPQPLTLTAPSATSERGPLVYDVVWVQWVLSHLTDADLHAFLLRCHTALVHSPASYLVIKENTAKAGFVMDRSDGSVTRSDVLFKEAFMAAGWKLVRQGVQTGFPKSLFAVRMWALQPMEGWQPDSEMKVEQKKAE